MKYLYCRMKPTGGRINNDFFRFLCVSHALKNASNLISVSKWAPVGAPVLPQMPETRDDRSVVLSPMKTAERSFSDLIGQSQPTMISISAYFGCSLMLYLLCLFRMKYRVYLMINCKTAYRKSISSRDTLKYTYIT